MPARYVVRLYDGAMQFRAIAPRAVSVDVGRVVNDVADGMVEVVPVAGVLLDEVGAVDIWRHEAERVSHVGLYVAETLTAQGSLKTVSWRIGVKSPLVYYVERLTSNLAAQTGSAALTIAKLLNDAWRCGDTPLTVAQAVGDLVSPNATTQAGILEPLSTIKSAALAAKTVLGFDLWMQVNFDIVATPSGTGLQLQPIVWTGEYGADRRVGRTSTPVLLYLTRIAEKWQVVRDKTQEVTVVRGTGSAASAVNSRTLESPYGNRREKTASASSNASGRVNSQTAEVLARGRPLRRLQVDLALPPDRYGLDLGDAFSVIVDGQLVDARLNVIHYGWNSQGEKVTGRVDVEVYSWT